MNLKVSKAAVNNYSTEHGSSTMCKAVLDYMCRSHTTMVTLTNDVNYAESMFLNCSAASYVARLLPDQLDNSVKGMIYFIEIVMII